MYTYYKGIITITCKCKILGVNKREYKIIMFNYKLTKHFISTAYCIKLIRCFLVPDETNNE